MPGQLKSRAGRRTSRGGEPLPWRLGRATVDGLWPPVDAHLLPEKAQPPAGGATGTSNAQEVRTAAAGLHELIRNEIIQPIHRAPAAGPGVGAQHPPPVLAFREDRPWPPSP